MIVNVDLCRAVRRVQRRRVRQIAPRRRLGHRTAPGNNAVADDLERHRGAGTTRRRQRQRVVPVHGRDTAVVTDARDRRARRRRGRSRHLQVERRGPGRRYRHGAAGRRQERRGGRSTDRHVVRAGRQAADVVAAVRVRHGDPAPSGAGRAHLHRRACADRGTARCERHGTADRTADRQRSTAHREDVAPELRGVQVRVNEARRRTVEQHVRLARSRQLVERVRVAAAVRVADAHVAVVVPAGLVVVEHHVEVPATGIDDEQLGARQRAVARRVLADVHPVDAERRAAVVRRLAVGDVLRAVRTTARVDVAEERGDHRMGRARKIERDVGRQRTVERDVAVVVDVERVVRGAEEVDREADRHQTRRAVVVVGQRVRCAPRKVEDRVRPFSAARRAARECDTGHRASQRDQPQKPCSHPRPFLVHRLSQIATILRRSARGSQELVSRARHFSTR